jgi:hypothetical protein
MPAPTAQVIVPADGTNAVANLQGRGTARWQLPYKLTKLRCARKANDGGFWPITSASQFGPRPLLVEPDIAIGIDQSRMVKLNRPELTF